LAIKFRSKSEIFSFFDVNGTKIERETEIRLDPLTGETSRLVFDPGLVVTPPDYSIAAEETGGSNCPFCPENLMKMTPVFPKEISEQGRITKGDATVFPNLFPYSKHNGVVVFSGEHYVRLDEFRLQMIIDAFSAAQKYIHKIRTLESKAKYSSINWNYLPLSGGSIIHPHLHVILSDHGTNYQTTVFENARQFEMESGKEYFTALVDTEKATGDRWIGETGQVAWVHAYAPKSHNDFIGVFHDSYTILSITEEGWNDFAIGLSNIFSVLAEQGFSSFNLVLTSDPEEREPVHVRIIPRLTIGRLDTSDINFFQALHAEPLTYKKPEEITKMGKKYFNT